MKPLLLPVLLLFALGAPLSPRSRADQPDEKPAATAPSSALAGLNAEYARRRAVALRPVTNWYRAQLDLLSQKLEEDRRALDTTRAQVAEKFWEDDQPELKAALLRQGWLWRSEENEQGVALAFAEDGWVRHVGLHGTWKITGPSEVTVRPDDDGPYLLRFNASGTAFVGDRRGVAGERGRAK